MLLGPQLGSTASQMLQVAKSDHKWTAVCRVSRGNGDDERVPEFAEGDSHPFSRLVVNDDVCVPTHLCLHAHAYDDNFNRVSQERAVEGNLCEFRKTDCHAVAVSPMSRCSPQAFVGQIHNQPIKQTRSGQTRP